MMQDIVNKVRNGERLSFEDGVTLFCEPDLLALGALANEVREKRHGDRTYFNRNMRIEVTNVCVDFGVSGLEIAQVALGFGASEICGPIANRRGLPIADDAKKKVKGKGMVALRALQQEEILAIIRRAKREPELHGGAERP